MAAPDPDPVQQTLDVLMNEMPRLFAGMALLFVISRIVGSFCGSEPSHAPIPKTMTRKEKQAAQTAEMLLRNDYAKWLEDEVLKLRISTLTLLESHEAHALLSRLEQRQLANLQQLKTIGKGLPSPQKVQTEWDELKKSVLTTGFARN
jgi:hypothetical protein